MSDQNTVKKEGWINLYWDGPFIHATKEEADKAADEERERATCLHITWEMEE